MDVERPAAEVVGVEDGVEEGLPQGGGERVAGVTVRLQEGRGGGETAGGHRVEIEEVLRSARSAGGQAGPALLVIGQAQPGEDRPQGALAAEEEQPGDGGMGPVPPAAEDPGLGEERRIGQLGPRVLGPPHGHEGAELPQGRGGEVLGGPAFEDGEIDGGVLAVAEHGADLVGGAVVVALAVAAVGAAEGAVADVHGAVPPSGAGDGDDEDVLALHALDGDVVLRDDAGADLGGVADGPPEGRAVAVRVGDPGDVEALGAVLLDAEEDQPADRVGEGGVGLPQAVGEAARGLLGLDAIVLVVAGDVVQVDHAAPSCPDVCPLII